jgi:multidrug resistance efflux pump
MKNRKPEIFYSDHVNEIISRQPRRIISWGTTAFFSVFILLLALAWLIRYPDVVPAAIEITTENPPVTLVSKITGRIYGLFVSDSEKVSSGSILAVMETTALLSEIELLKSVIDTTERPEHLSPESLPLLSRLGELQSYYAAFMKSLTDYNTYVKNDFYGAKINSVTEEILGLQEYISKMRIKESIISENKKIEQRKFRRDSALFAGKVLSESDFERSRQSFNIVNLELQQAGIDRSGKIIELAEKRQLLQDYRIKREEERLNLLSVLNETFLNLRAQIKMWDNKYLLISPVDGIVTFTKFWSRNQSVEAGQSVLNVVPEKAGDYIGRINLNMQRSGKVKIGEVVNIKLSGFPYLEYGMVRGSVKTKSLVTSGDAYVIEVSLPQGLTTLYGKKLEFTQNMQGTAEILTDNLRLLQKIINPFRHLISRNKI